MLGMNRTQLSSYPKQVTLKVWLKTGISFDNKYTLDETTFGDVKLSAIQYLLQEFPSTTSLHSSISSVDLTSKSHSTGKEIKNYRLISMQSRRPVEDQSLLKSGLVTDGDEYLLSPKKKNEAVNDQKSNKNSSISLTIIEEKTRSLPTSSPLGLHNARINIRREFRTDLNRILATLLETSQKLLWCHPDAENIFRQAEEFLLQSSSNESDHSKTTTSDNIDDSDNKLMKINRLIDMGFTDQQARRALKKTRYDFQSAMELLLVNPDIEGSIDIEEETNTIEQKPETKTSSLFNRDGPFVSLRKFRQNQFRPNQRAIRALQEMGFENDSIIEALRIFNNDKNAACNYLLSDAQSQVRIQAANQEQPIDPNSNIYRTIMENPIVQKTLNNPKCFFILLHIMDNPGLITNYMNDPDIGNMLVQISRIYHSDIDSMNSTVLASEQQTLSSQVPTHLGGRTSTDDDDDDDDESD